MFSSIKLIPVFLLVLGGFYTYHSYTTNKLSNIISQKEADNVILRANQETLLEAEAKNRAAFLELQTSLEEQHEALKNLSKRYSTLVKERDEYLSIFRRHDLTNLARRKPGLIEPRINSGTEKVFRQLEQDSREITDVEKN